MAKKRITVKPRKSRAGEKRNRRFRPAEEPVPMQLTERDIAALEAIAGHRFLSGEQLRRLVYRCSASRVRRRLRMLYDHRLVDRVALVSQPSKGIPPFVYVLRKVGAEALRELDIAADARELNRRNVRQLRHNLLVTDTYIALGEATEACGYAVADWQDAEALKLPSRRGPAKAERVVHRDLQKPVSFLPDAAFTLQLPNGQSYFFFLEIDLATHSLSVWRERALLYRAYADPAAGLFRRRFGRETFRLVIVTTNDYRGNSRRDNILRTIGETIGPSELFLAATLDEAQPGTILRAVWYRPGIRQPVCLTANPRPRLIVGGQGTTG